MEKEINQRREFIKLNSLAGLGVLTFGTIGGCTTNRNLVSQNFKDTSDQTFAKMDFEGILNRYKVALFNRFLPNMDKFVVDHEFGGFMCWLNIATGKHENTNKKAWFEGRGIWTYSFLYNNFEKNPRYLEIARKAKDFILKLLPADDKFYPGMYTREGVPLSKEEGDIYGNLFVAEGLAEYAKASGEIEYFNLAKKIIFKAVARYDSPDYSYPYRAEVRLPGPRILGHWMILLSITTQMLRHEPNREIQALADRCVDAIMNHHLNPKSKLLNEAKAHNFSHLSDSIASQVGDIGHGCESLAFVMNYAVLQKNAKLFNTAKDAFKKHVSVATDPVYGGYFHILDNIDKYTWKIVDKLRWLQEEIMIGSLIILEHTGDPWAIKCFMETDAYVQDKFVHPEYAFVVDSGDRDVTTHSQIRAEHYHHPRQLMVTLLAIDRILKRGRKPSGLFS